MGIHTGPVYRVADINANRNVAGGGINIAQRVMDCGDSGHILVSKTVADVLAQVSRWNGSLHELGEAEVKHGVRVHLFNLYTEEAGNPKAPKKLSATKALHKSDSGRTPRVARSGPHQKQRSGFRTSSEIKARTVSPRTQDVKTPVIQSGQHRRLQVSIRNVGLLFGIVVLVLGAIAFAVPSVRRGILSAAAEKRVSPSGIPPLTDGKYLAVLPFGVEGESRILKSVAEGLNQELSAKLLALRDVTVTSARAAESVDPRGNPVTIARSLGANLIVRGTVQGDDKAIQITVNLDDVTSGRRRFSQKFPGMRRDLLDLEDQIYTRILRALELNPSGEEMNRVAPRPTADPEAYELYNKGRSVYRGHPDVGQVKIAIGFYEEAIRKDHGFALAYASMADASLTMYRETQDAIWTQRAMAAAQRAQALDDNLAEAHLSLGAVYRETGKTEEAIFQLKRAKQLSPKSDDYYRRLGRVYEDAGRNRQAAMEFQNAVTINPYYWLNYNELGTAYLNVGEYGKALNSFRRVVEFDPTNPLGRQNIGVVYFSQGKYEESISEFESAITLQTSNPDVFSNLGLAYLYLGRYPEGLKVLEKSAEMSPNNDAIMGNLADGYRWSRQEKKAMATYDKAISLANKELEVNPKDATTLASLGLYHAKKGDLALAEHCLHRARSIDASDPQLIYDEAVVLVLANRPEPALASLRSAFEKGASPEQARLDPEFQSLRTNPAFQKLVSDFLEKPKQ